MGVAGTAVDGAHGSASSPRDTATVPTPPDHPSFGSTFRRQLRETVLTELIIGVLRLGLLSAPAALGYLVAGWLGVLLGLIIGAVLAGLAVPLLISIGVLAAGSELHAVRDRRRG